MTKDAAQPQDQARRHSRPTPKAQNMFIVCQIGAREHYAIPRALHARGALAGLVTDFWVNPASPIGKIPGGRRLKDRYHADLASAKVIAPNLRMLAYEAAVRMGKRSGWDVVIKRNALFQEQALFRLSSLITDDRSPITLFSYSYAALEIFRFAKSRGWKTVLGQIDPGPEEERIVAAERERYRHLASSWQPAPASYWASWREEIDLADRILVNSEWSRQCLLKEGVPEAKIQVVPLVYGKVISGQRSEVGGQRSEVGDQESFNIQNSKLKIQNPPPKRVLFLGQVNLRKGVGRLLDAMRLLKDEPVELALAGPSQVDASAWADLPNVRWIGPVPRSEVERHYVDADFFILPTLSDGYALTQLEAMSHGLPVMASKHCGEAVRHGENGWILDDLEPETIATAIRHAVANPLDPSLVRPPEFSLDDLGEAVGVNF